MKKFESYQTSFEELGNFFEKFLQDIAIFIINNPRMAVDIEVDYEDNIVSSKVYYEDTMQPNDGWCIFWELTGFKAERFIQHHLNVKQTIFEFEHRKLNTIFSQ